MREIGRVGRRSSNRLALGWAIGLASYAVAECLRLSLGSGAISAQEVRIPKQSDWTDQGTVLKPGTWDARLVGGFSPCTMIKKKGTYFLYYIGARGGRRNDNGPAWRALGVATSTDGKVFTKYSGNPIITHWEPSGHVNAEEAGVWTAAAMMDRGQILMYAGVMTAISATGVNDDGKLYASTDGFTFKEVAKVLDHADRSIWGFGDEFDPFGVFKHPSDGTWHMYYSAATAGWGLGHISGPHRDKFTPSTSGPVLTDGADIVGGGCNAIFISPTKIALFIDRADGSPKWSHWVTQVRTASVDSPKKLSAPVETYDFTDTMGTALFLDAGAGKWFMFYNNGKEQFTNNPGKGTVISLRTAPVVR